MEIPNESIIKIGELVVGCRGGSRKRPKELYLRLTHGTLSESLKAEYTERRTIKWLYHILNALEKE